MSRPVARTSRRELWQGTDLLLGREVVVHLFRSAASDRPDVSRAIRTISTLDDPRLARVLDANLLTSPPYAITEWITGVSLSDVLATGPLDPAVAAELVAQAADALSRAHAAGLAHLRLTPDSVRWSTCGEVKLLGVGIESAVFGTRVPDPARHDVRGLGTLLYAALTGHWPGPSSTQLPLAPTRLGRPRRPRHLRRGIPRPLDTITRQAMAGWPRHRRSSIETAAQLADALSSALAIPRVANVWSSRRDLGPPVPDQARRDARQEVNE